MTFTIRYLFKHADVHTHAHFRSLLRVSCVGGHECFTAVELIWAVLLIVAVWVHCSDLCGCVQLS